MTDRLSILKHVKLLAEQFDIVSVGKYERAEIKIRFDQLRQDGLTVEECEIKLSDEYNKSVERIHRIIYEKN